MKTRIALLGIGGLLVLNVHGYNILSNGGFEAGTLSPWYQSIDYYGSENWNVTSAAAYTGAYCATDVGNKLIEQDFAPVPVTDILSLTFALRNVGGFVNNVYFRYSDNTEIENIIWLQDSNWHTYDFTSYLDSNRSLVSFGVFGFTNGRTYLDDASINVVPEPVSLALLGVAGLAFLLRRRL
jgi:hypothetical protein